MKPSRPLYEREPELAAAAEAVDALCGAQSVGGLLVFSGEAGLGKTALLAEIQAMAADRCYLSVEQVVDTAGLTIDTPVQRLLLNRMMVAGVVETPNGAHFTTCTPDYERDEKFQRAYAAAASGTEEDWATFSARFLEGDEAAYQAAVAAFAEEAK